MFAVSADSERKDGTGFDRHSVLRQPDPAPLSELCMLGKDRDCNSRTIRQAQLDALIRLVPLTVCANIINAMVIAFGLFGQIPGWQLWTWLGSFAVICSVRLVRALRLRDDPVYAARKPASLKTVLPPVILLSLLWTIPPVFWFPVVSLHEQVLIAIVVTGMMAGGSVTLGAVPLAALAYMGILTVATIILMTEIGSPLSILMSTVFGFALGWSVLWNSRQFVGHLRARIEVEEQAAMMGLLREFEATGSDWLWELGADLRVGYVSPAFIEATGLSPSKLVGKAFLSLLDPTGNSERVSAGTRKLFEALRAGKTFREITVPVFEGHRWWVFSGQPLYDLSGCAMGWRGVGSDVTESRLTGRNSIRAERHDPLTGLSNRILIREQIEESLLRQTSGGGCALLLVDLDRFKLVNDTLGHAVGDQLLVEVARRLEEVSNHALVGRLGGDEFAVVDPHRHDAAALALLAEQIIDRLSAPYRLGAAAPINIGATIGIAFSPDHGISQEELTRNADLALYRAKNAQRGSFQFFLAEMAEQAIEARRLESDVRAALEDGQLSLAYQPIVNADTHQVIGREALLRWMHPQRGAIAPEVFIPVIEDAGLIGAVGDWVLREACREAAGWGDEARIAVNVSAAQIAGASLVGTVVNALATSGLAAERLELEVTESIFLAKDEVTLDSLARLRAIGVRLVLDDFGMGYSSFGYLGRGSFSKIKIDRSFVSAACQGGPEARAIVDSMVALARGLKLEITAEGVETEEQAIAMREAGCGQLQGYFFGRPVPAAGILPPLQTPLTNHKGQNNHTRVA